MTPFLDPFWAPGKLKQAKNGPFLEKGGSKKGSFWGHFDPLLDPLWDPYIQIPSRSFPKSPQNDPLERSMGTPWGAPGLYPATFPLLS